MTSTDSSRDWRGITLVIVGAFCFSLAIPFIRWTDGLNTQTIAFFRALFGFLFLCLLIPRTREPIQFAVYRAQIPRLLVLGMFVSMTVVLYTYAVQHTTAANAALLCNSAPLYVALLGPLALHEPLARYTWPSLTLAVIGMICVSNPGQLDLASAEASGLLAAAAAGFTYALVMLFSRSLRGHITGLTQTLWSDGLVALVLLPWAVRAPAGTVLHNLPMLIPLGVFSLGLSYLLYFQGLQRLSAQVVSVAALFEPVSGALIGLLLFAEVPNALGWIGGGLILVSIYLISLE